MSSSVNAVNPNDVSSALKSATGNSTMDKNSFLLLLVTQFKYQDPLNPMDDKEFVAQLAQFNALEQQMNTNEKMDSLVSLQTEQQMLSALNYIGKEVSARGTQVSVEEGKATLIQYSLADQAAHVTVSLMDSNNNLVRSVVLSGAAAGIHDFQWDKLDKSGVAMNSKGGRVADGTYNVAISATDANGEFIAVDTSVTGKVKGVSKYQNEQWLTLTDNRVVNVAYVREVQDTSSTKTDDDTKGDANTDDKDDGDGKDEGATENPETSGTEETSSKS